MQGQDGIEGRGREGRLGQARGRNRKACRRRRETGRRKRRKKGGIQVMGGRHQAYLEGERQIGGQ